MMPSVLTFCRVLAPGALSARLLHTLFVFCATSLMLSIAVYTFILILLLKSVPPAPAPRRAGRHVTFRERPSIVPALALPAVLAARARTPSPSSRQATAAAARPPSLSLMATPGALEPLSPDVAEDPLRALGRFCAFLASNTARAWRREEELERTPPLAGLEPYLDVVREDLARIDEMVAPEGDSEDSEDSEEDGKKEREEDSEQVKEKVKEKDQEAVAVAVTGGAEVKDRESAGENASASASARAGAGAGDADADADASDEPGLVNPDQATAHAR